MVVVSPLILLALSSAAHAGQTIVVPDDQPTLAAALGVAINHDAIVLPAGTHDLGGAVLEHITIIGAGPATVLVDAGEPNQAVEAGHHARLVNLTIDGEGRRALLCTKSGSKLVLTAVTLTNGGDSPDGLGGGLIYTDRCDLAVVDSILESTTVATDGGLIWSADGNVTVIDSSLVGGIAANGGAVWSSGGEVYATGSTFSGGSVSVDGAAIYSAASPVGLVETSVIGNNSGGQGAIYQEGDLISVHRSSFSSNGAGFDAGAVSKHGGTLEVADSTFSSNFSGGAGGISCTTGADCIVTDSTFEGNSGTNGGAMNLSGASGSWQRNLFCSNDVTGTFLSGNGGAVLTGFGTAGDAQANVYVDNSAENVGGAVLADSDASFSHETFVGNAATGDGSAIYAVFATVSVSDSLFIDQLDTPALSEFGGSITTSTSWFFDNLAGNSTNPLNPSDVTGVDPQLVNAASNACDRAPFAPAVGSPLIDAGSGPNDADGSPGDIGATGGPFADTTDADGDGVSIWLDCDDTDNSVGGQTLLFPDGDNDGYGDFFAQGVGCPSPGSAPVSGDCKDDDATISPGSLEVFGNAEDDDCNGGVDDGTVWYPDLDGDGYGDLNAGVASVTAPAGFIADGSDCDDGAYGVNPAASEVCDGSVDEDCDGLVDDADPSVVGAPDWNNDVDGDGYGHATATTRACVQPSNTVLDTSDCDDTNPAISPAATEVCDGAVDEDCDGLVDDADPSVAATVTFYVDSDGDGSAGTAVLACDVPVGGSATADDCDDSNDAIGPFALEVCDPLDVDEDCSGASDDLDPGVSNLNIFYVDADLDGFGGTTVVRACDLPIGAVANHADCDDSSNLSNPDADEVCDGSVDEDCDGLVDDDDPSLVGAPSFYVDSDGDGFPGTVASACVMPSDAAVVASDCDDSDDAISPGEQEVCDAVDVDEDCDGLADDADTSVVGQSSWFADTDGDGFGDPTVGTTSCDGLGNVLDNTDCDDQRSDVNPSSNEVCDPDDVDEDCDGTADDLDPSVMGQAERVPDADGDGYGDDKAIPVMTCDGSTDASDCDDTSDEVYPGAEEIWYDGIDQDCDGNDGDKDGDGATGADDCDDNDPARYPGATDYPDDGIDQDCDGSDAIYLYANGGSCGCDASAAAPAPWLGLLFLVVGARR